VAVIPTPPCIAGLGRMIAAGEDPLYIARRHGALCFGRCGNADPQALIIAIAAQQAFHLSSAEGELALAQQQFTCNKRPKAIHCILVMVKLKKQLYKRILPVPLHIRNAPTKLIRMGYAKYYKYAHTMPTLMCLKNTCRKNSRQIFYQTQRDRFRKNHQERIMSGDRRKIMPEINHCMNPNYMDNFD